MSTPEHVAQMIIARLGAIQTIEDPAAATREIAAVLQDALPGPSAQALLAGTPDTGTVDALLAALPDDTELYTVTENDVDDDGGLVSCEVDTRALLAHALGRAGAHAR